MNQNGLAKGAVIGIVAVLLLLVAAGVVKFVVFSPENVALKLCEQSDALTAEGDASFQKGDAAGAKAKFDEALSKTERILKDYRETLSAEQAALLKMKAERRLAAMGSPKGVIDSMIKAIGVPKGDEYLDYWDFDGVAEEVMQKEWATLDPQQKTRLSTFCHDGTKRLVDQTRDMISLVQVTFLDEKIEGDRAQVQTQWEAMQRKLEVPFTTREASGLWKVVDFEVSAIGGGPASFLREALDRCTQDTGLEPFLSSPDFEKKLEESYVALLEEKQKSIDIGGTGGGPKGPTWTLTQETEVKYGDQVVATLPAGTTVEIMEEAETPSGKITLISSESKDGPPVAGWVPSENLSKSEK